MKNKKVFSKLFFLGLIGLFLVSSEMFAEKLVIQNYIVKVRKVPSMIGPIVGELKHNDKVNEIERRNNFVRIKAKGFEGWVPLSAVIAEKKLTIKKGKKVEAGETQDILAAGKGLGTTSEEISDNKSDTVRGQRHLDEVEANTETKDSDIKKFKAKGELKPGQKTTDSK